MKGKLSEGVPGNELDTKPTAHHLSWPHWPPFPLTANGFRAQIGEREDRRLGGRPSQWGNSWPREEANLTGFWAGCSALFIDGQWFAKVRALWGPLEIFGKPPFQQLLSAKRNCGALKSGSWNFSTAAQDIFHASRGMSHLFGRCLPLCYISNLECSPKGSWGTLHPHMVVLLRVELRWMT